MKNLVSNTTIERARKVVEGMLSDGWMYPERTDFYPDLSAKDPYYFSSCVQNLQIMKCYALVQFADDLGGFGEKHLRHWAKLDALESECYEAAGRIRKSGIETAKTGQRWGIAGRYIPADHPVEIHEVFGGVA